MRAALREEMFRRLEDEIGETLEPNDTVGNGLALLKHFPEWADSRRFLEDRKKMLAAAQAYGYSRQEFDRTTDYRVFLMLRDAMKGVE